MTKEVKETLAMNTSPTELMDADHFKIVITPERKRAIRQQRKQREAVVYTPNNQFEDYSSY
jgi:hypothetical protein